MKKHSSKAVMSNCVSVVKTEATVIGLDLGDKFSQYCVMGADGTKQQEGKLRTTREALRAWFEHLPPAMVALECGTHSLWVSALLTELGHRVLVANPRKVRAIFSNERKCDRVDAEMLARIARFDPQLLSPVVHRSSELQAHLTLLRARDTLVTARTQLINSVRSLSKVMGGRLPSCSAESFHRRVGAHLPPPVAPQLKPLVTQIALLTRQIRRYDQAVEYLARQHYPQTAVMRQVGGVAALTAVAYVLTIGDPHRFRHSRQVGPYLGMVPRRRSSSQSDPQLHISKTGNGYLRRLLVSSAHYILGPFGPPCDLRTAGLRICERGGKNAKKRAVVAVARKMAVLLHRLWITGEVYEPERRNVVAVAA
jgi:transposase